LNSRRSHDLLVFGIAVIVLAADQISKYWVRHNLMPGVPWSPAPSLRPILSFTYVTNIGASFGLLPQLRSFYPFIITGVIAVILLFYRQLPANPKLVLVGLGMQLGGALGNLLDRLLHGRVIDFIDLNFWPLQEWPVFNVADSSVVVGVCILALLLLFEEPLVSSSDTLGDENERV
jgi:signal peptidase II